jgi:hypothetical protein
MSKYNCFTNLKHLIFWNRGSSKLQLIPCTYCMSDTFSSELCIMPFWCESFGILRSFQRRPSGFVPFDCSLLTCRFSPRIWARFVYEFVQHANLARVTCLIHARNHHEIWFKWTVTAAELALFYKFIQLFYLTPVTCLIHATNHHEI